MAPPKPKAHKAQTQPLTVLLRSICLDYPAGCGILREMLQNADDAGASRVRFVLDLNSHPTDNLLHPDLAQYQGPALLAYNNAIFPAEDFESLKRIGDSRKLQDGYSTGKFGRGFNSVYNWTDSPSIVSEENLLILDPHHGWSATLPDNSPPGGPMWDFVAHGENVEIRNQMRGFSAIMKEFDKPYNGTIIRIPLRTELQAEASEICKKPTTVSDVDAVLKNFASEFGTSGLLFMKNIERIEIEIGDNVAFTIKICNMEHVRRNKNSVNELVRAAPAGLERPFDVSFDIDIESGSPTLVSRTSFAVHHSVAADPADKQLRSWCKAHAMIPWVAVAAPISGDIPAKGNGSLFTVLPLPIPTNQLVHIHGLFSLSSDRARLHDAKDSGVQDQLPSQWNEWLFASPVPMAWVNMLLHIAKRDHNRAAFDKWPLALTKPGDMLEGMALKVLKLIHNDAYKLWYTDLGYISSSEGILANGDEPQALRRALYEVQVPVVYLPDTLLHIVQNSNVMGRLNPRSLCTHLERSRSKVREAHENTKRVLLEYILSDPSFCQYGEVELFPFEDGTYKSVDQCIAFVPHDKDESALFDRDRSQSVDLEKLSKQTMQTLRDGLLYSYLHSSLKQRSSMDFKAYCMSTYFKDFDSHEDLVSLDKDMQTFVSKVWCWIIARGYSLADMHLSCLWLVPLSNGQYRKLKPQNPSSGTIYAPPGDIGDFLRRMTTVNPVHNKPILRSDNISSQALELFLNASANDSSMLVENGAVLDDFCRWLTNIPEVLEQASDADKLCLHEILVSNRHLCRDLAATSEELVRLKIFQQMSWTPENNLEPLLSWASLNGYSQAIGLQDNVPMPRETKTIFLDARSETTSKFLTEFQLAACPSIVGLLKEFTISYWEEGRFEGLSISCREYSARLLLSHFYNFDKHTQQRVASLPFIPTCCLDGKTISKLATAAELIDSSSALLRGLHFDDEEVYPVNWAIHEFRGVLIECGLQTSITQDLAKSRIRRFAGAHSDLGMIWGRAYKLLQSKVEWLPDADKELTSIIRRFEWLPATNCHGKKTLASASNCRGLEDHLLVGLVHPLVKLDIMADWRQQLGWDEVISSATLVEQLKQGIEKDDAEIANAVLKYIEVKGQSEILFEKLVNLRCVMTQAGRFVSPQTAFHTGCERLEPYLHNVNSNFWNNNSMLLSKLNIKEKPSLEDLFQVQKELQRKPESKEEATLDERDIGIAVEIVRLASVFDREQLLNLMIPTASGNLCKIEETTYNDLGSLWHAQGDINFTHPDIPCAVTVKLRIEPLSERIQKGELGLVDGEDEDEFDQREQVATRIADTLGRYPVEGTFKEYLANADDAKAREINWLLDSRQHPQKSLVSPGLSAYQGPALLVHNDETFQEKDFDGFKDVGRGSKTEDPTTIGKFGRGSQTMYHWTDVPMLLSGEYLVILDPLQQALQMNYRTGHRKSGVKIKLSTLKSYCLDQLAPFEGLWCYSRELEYYDGTIFRFPLRTAAVQSKLRESKTVLDYDATQRYMQQFLDEARISLLFLRNVRSIDFKVFEESHTRWSVRSSRARMNDDFSDWTVCTVTEGDGSDLGTRIVDRWWTAVQDVPETPTELPHRHKRSLKNVECGIAALISSKPTSKDTEPPVAPKARIFSSLPLPSEWELPVHIHSTFITFGDRNSIMTESSFREDGADWNKWLLTTAIPSLYLSFLEDVARKIGQDAFRFWPQVPPEDSLSQLVYNSFWEQLCNSSCRLFPLARQPGNKKRQPPKLLELKEATFDFGHNLRWNILRNFLGSEIPTLVRVPPPVAKELRSLSTTVSFVTPSLLRKVLRSEEAAENLTKIKSESKLKVLDFLLKEIIPKCDADFEELNGCRVIPLSDGTMGMLAMEESFQQAVTYYIASKSEVELFDFASELLTPEDQGNDFKLQVLRCQKKFNIKLLDLSDVGALLGKKRFQQFNSSADFEAWLRQFWKFWHEREINHKEFIHHIFTSASGVYNYPILEASRDGVKTYLSPSDLERLPSVLEPADEQHKKLCDKISGLYTLNTNFIPLYLKEAESSLDNASSFSRLIKSLSILAPKHSGGLERYIREIFGEVELQVLRQLVRHYFAMYDYDLFALKDQIKLLPIWPTIDTKRHYITASTALVANDYDLLVPQMSGYGLFLELEIVGSYEATLHSLGVQKIADSKLLETRILPHLPREVTSHGEERYELFISALSRVCEANHPRHFSKKARMPRNKEKERFINVLRGASLAPAENGLLHTANALFDHTDNIFLAAFREEAKVRFLMKAIRRHKQFWLDIGLKQKKDGHFTEHYILCLQTMRKRLEARNGQLLDSQLASDAQAVLEPLTSRTYDPYFSDNNWLTIQEEGVFPALTALNSEPNYRRDYMAVIAASKPLLLLKDLVMRQYKPICWSQIPFALVEPSRTAFGKITSHGRPPASIVWSHLSNLMQLAQHLTEDAIPDFLSDLTSTYDYLQSNLSESCNAFVDVTSPLWLNLAVTDNTLVSVDDLKSSWLKIEHLVLSSPCDSPPLMSVQPRLMQYERLLKVLGCRTIVYPTIARPETGIGESLSESMTRMRHERKMLDITFSAEGQDVQAHKILLAAASDYFAVHISGRWAALPKIPLDDISFHSLSTVIDFIYADVFDWTPTRATDKDDLNVIADKIDNLLDLLTAADRFLMPALTAQVEDEFLCAGRLFIRIDNVLDIRARAAEANAYHLERACTEFYEQNKVPVDLIYAERGE